VYVLSVFFSRKIFFQSLDDSIAAAGSSAPGGLSIVTDENASIPVTLSQV
jgi:hypothetical protein